MAYTLRDDIAEMRRLLHDEATGYSHDELNQFLNEYLENEFLAGCGAMEGELIEEDRRRHN